MASISAQILPNATIIHLKPFHSLQTSHNSSYPFPPTNHNHNRNLILPKCTSNTSSPAPVDPTDPFPTPDSITTTPAELFPIEKRRPSEIIRDRKSRMGIVKREPPNFEIGWKRTKSIPLEKPTGYVIMDFLSKLETLMGLEFGSTELLAKTGEIVAEKAREEAEVLLEEGKVEDRMVTELLRVLKLMEMDLAMVKASVKEDTLNQRLEQAKARCRQAILVANSF